MPARCQRSAARRSSRQGARKRSDLDADRSSARRQQTGRSRTVWRAGAPIARARIRPQSVAQRRRSTNSGSAGAGDRHSAGQPAAPLRSASQCLGVCGVEWVSARWRPSRDRSGCGRRGRCSWAFVTGGVAFVLVVYVMARRIERDQIKRANGASEDDDDDDELCDDDEPEDIRRWTQLQVKRAKTWAARTARLVRRPSDATSDGTLVLGIITRRPRHVARSEHQMVSLEDSGNPLGWARSRWPSRALHGRGRPWGLLAGLSAAECCRGRSAQVAAAQTQNMTTRTIRIASQSATPVTYEKSLPSVRTTAYPSNVTTSPRGPKRPPSVRFSRSIPRKSGTPATRRQLLSSATPGYASPVPQRPAVATRGRAGIESPPGAGTGKGEGRCACAEPWPSHWAPLRSLGRRMLGQRKYGGRRRPALVAGAAQPRVELVFDSALDDQPGAEPSQFRQRLARALTNPHGQHPLDPSFYLRRRRYGTSHGVGLLHRLAGLEGTYAAALTAPTLFTALLRRDPDRTAAAVPRCRPSMLCRCMSSAFRVAV